jgi:membrane protease YdiL (CAAX protease family)
MTRRHFAKLGGIFALGVVRLIGLVALLGVITSLHPVAQLMLLPAALGLIVARYVLQVPAFRWGRVLRRWVSPTLAAEPTAFARTRERAVLLLRRPPSYARLALAMALMAALVPFSAGVVGGACANGELIRVDWSLSSPDAGAGKVIQLVTGALIFTWYLLMEEFVMRGWLLFPLRKLFNAPIAVAVTGYLFAVMHLIPSVAQYHLLGGIIFGTAAVLSGSILYPVGLHLAHNLAVLAWDRFFDAFGAGAVSCSGARPAFFVLLASLFYVLWIGRRAKLRFAKSAG